MINKKSQDKIKKIRNSGLFCCVTIKSDYNYVWDVYLTLAEQEKDVHKVTHRASDEDLNKAVDNVYEKVKELIKCN